MVEDNLNVIYCISWILTIVNIRYFAVSSVIVVDFKFVGDYETFVRFAVIIYVPICTFILIDALFHTEKHK